jgi:hypothetical protein
MTNRRTIHDDERLRQMPDTSHFEVFNGYDCCALAAHHNLSAGGGAAL